MKRLLLAFSLLGSSAAVIANDLQLQLDKVTVSGLSAGGYMATQFHLAHADWVKGAGVLAAGPYYCAENAITTALERCVSKMETPVSLAKLNEKIDKWRAEGRIAPLSALQDSKVWLFHGQQDTKVIREVSDLLHQQYSQWLTPEQLTYVTDKEVSHVFPTLDQGGDCLVSSPPFIGNCGYDAVGAMFSHLLDEATTPTAAPSGKIITIDQQALAPTSGKTLADQGYAYVPQACTAGASCSVHISFHGCNQNAEAVGLAYVEQTDFHRWADANHMVIVYPQVKKSLFMPMNPQACWDWWGYTDASYATSSGPQIDAVRRILFGYQQWSL